MSTEQFDRLEEGGLNGFTSVRRSSVNSWGREQADPMREARIASAVSLIADVMTARTPAYALREAIAPTHPDMARLIDSNYPHLFREGMSVSDFPLLMGDVLDRMLLARFREGLNPWRQYIRVAPRPLRDFRTVRRIKTDGGDGRWNQLGEYGGLTYTEMSETGYTYSPELYGKAMKLSFRQIMNDDLSAFEEIPAILARGGRRTVHHFATSLLFDSSGPHASYFTVGNGNLLSGNPAFSVNALGTALETLAGFTDSEGEPISVDGLLLVHGPGLHVTVNNVLNQLTVDVNENGGSTNSRIRVNNWIIQGLTPVMDPYIPIVATTNGATSWLLMANPATNRPAAEVGFLAGFGEPALYQKLANTTRVGGGVDQMAGDFSSMAQEYKGVIGFGGTRMEPKAGVGSNGSGS